MMQYNSIAWDSHADGPGLRVVLFTQGCPYLCPWCHSPHTRHLQPLLLFNAAMCTQCRHCASVCPVGAHSFADDCHRIDRSVCRGCGQCVRDCPNSAGASSCAALMIVPVSASVDSLFTLLLPQLRLCGAITVSGGEPLLQWQDVASLLARCKSAGIDTAVETTLTADETIIEYLLPLVDLWLVGLRPLESGSPGAPLPDIAVVERNLRLLSDAEVCIRYPLIPGYTDSIRSMSAAAGIMNGAGIKAIDVLPFNANTSHYHAAMGERFGLTCQARPESLQCAIGYFRERGFQIVTKP